MIVETVLTALAAVLLAIRMTRQRTFRVSRLWIMPVAVLVVLAFGLRGASMSSLDLAAIGAGIVGGAVLGVWRADAALDRIDVATRSIMTKPNIWFALTFAATFALKAIVRHGPAASFHEATDFVMCLTAASICAQRLQLYRMFKRAETG